ncbi:MAG: selenide, water dikinase SelD, partial [Planctomycetales bacterium]|nr:selenide, water dikinase SelD [Planctomycetales bacterium]
MRESLPQHTVVLLGAGHTNSHVIRMWRMQPLCDVQLICVSDFGMATYSGMLPGTLAGQYDLVEMQIDLVRLCAAAGVRLLRAEVTGLDADNCELLLADRPPLRYDLLSIGIGSVPATVPDASGIGLAIKPMQTFLDRLDQRLAKLAEARLSRPWRIAIAGAGAAGFEIACCLPSRIRRAYGMAVPEVTLVDRSPEMLSGMPARTRELARRELAARGIQVLLGREIVRIDENGQLCYADGNTLEFDLVIWATSAQAPPLLSCFDLPTDDRGFLLTRDTLQSVGSDAVFAVGDTGTCENHPRPKAGVYAVRQSPVLWENIRRHFAGRPPVRWRPQSSFLSLLNTGDGKAIFTYKKISLHARWCWKLKDAIDRRFIAKFQDYQPAMRSEALVDPSSPMYCGGCGCKVGGDLLSRVLRRLNNPPASHVLVGLAQPDDVALLLTAEGTATVATADFFTAFLDDPYLLGRIAALNALSDMYAKGAKSLGALALVTVPHGPPAEQEQFLLQLLDGSLRELRAADVPLVGGHTIEAAQTTIGFTILGEVAPTALAGKGQLREGDRLVLTKPLGTGVLLAAHMQARCQSDWMESLLDCMLTSNQAAGAIAQQFQLKAVTDVTGFGLAGHLLEML